MYEKLYEKMYDEKKYQKYSIHDNIYDSKVEKLGNKVDAKEIDKDEPLRCRYERSQYANSPAFKVHTNVFLLASAMHEDQSFSTWDYLNQRALFWLLSMILVCLAWILDILEATLRQWGQCTSL